KDGALDEFDYLSDELLGDPPRRHFMSEMDFGKPTVCAINGYALGGGLELALACDIRIAAENATLGLPEARVGSMPGAGGTQRLPRSIALSDAMYMLLTAEAIDARKALEMRLISECLPPDQLLDRAVAIAGAVSRNAPLSIK